MYHLPCLVLTVELLGGVHYDGCIQGVHHRSLSSYHDIHFGVGAEELTEDGGDVTHIEADRRMIGFFNHSNREMH